MRLLPIAMALVLLPACQGPALGRIERRADRLADSIRDKLGPRGLVQGWARRLDHAARRSPEVLLDDDLRRLEGSVRRAAGGLAAEIAHAPRTIADDGLALLDDSARRLHRLQNLPGTWDQVSPEGAARRLSHVVEDWPGLLLLDKPILPHPDDRRYRTDPADDRPEARWLERILERLGI